MTEQMVTSETGGMKGSKPAQLAGIDPSALLALAEVSGKGAEKYGDPYNYLKGYDWSLSFNALQRHALAFWGGEDEDPESGLPHMAHAAWHALALVAFLQRGAGSDDRPPTRAAVGVQRLVDDVNKAEGKARLEVGEMYNVDRDAVLQPLGIPSVMAGRTVWLLSHFHDDSPNVVVEAMGGERRLVGHEFLKPLT